MKEQDKAPALNSKLSAPASVEFTHIDHGAAATPKEDRFRFHITTLDIIAFGILVLAYASAIVAIIVAFGFVLGKVSGSDGVKIITACVGGSTISGITAALIGKRK